MIDAPAPRERDTPGTSPYLPQLDALRAFAVLPVLVHHYRGAYFEGNLTYWAAAGVRLFFVLSGFLITGILLRSRRHAERTDGRKLAVLLRFYGRRFLRIFPVYYLVVAISLALGVEPARRIVWWLLTYTLNIHMASQGWYEATFAHFWSLSVEEQFYVCWPWLVLLCPGRHLLRMAAAVTLAAPLYRLAYVLSGYSLTTGLGTYIGTLACLDALGAGAVLAIARLSASPATVWEKRLRRIAAPAAAAVLAVSLSGWWRDLEIVLHDTAQAVLFAGLIHASSKASTGVSGAILGWSPIQYVGRISYGLYVYHPFIPTMLASARAWFGVSRVWRGWGAFGVATALALGIASASWHLFEKPINRLKRHFEEPS